MGGVPEGGDPNPVPPQNSFFSSLSGGLLVEFWWCLKGQDSMRKPTEKEERMKFAVGRKKSAKFQPPHPSGPPTLRAPHPSNPHPSGPHPSGPQPFGPTFSGFGPPPLRAPTPSGPHQKQNWPNTVWPNLVNKNWPNLAKSGLAKCGRNQKFKIVGLLFGQKSAPNG